MKIYLRGVILSVSEPETVGQNNVRIQHCVIQHEFAQEPKYNKYAMFDVIGDRIERLALKPQDDVELAIDLNARQGSGGRWFNSLTAFAVERDKKRYHYYESNRQRVAVMPDGKPADGANMTGQPAAASTAENPAESVDISY